MIEEVREMLNEKASLEREYLELVHISDEMNLSAEIHDKMIMANIAHSLAVIADALADRKTEPTISKMGQVDKDINVRSKDEPQTCDTCKHKGEYAYCRLCGRLSENNYEPKDEPQTCSVSGRPYSECADCEHFRCTADEPQKIMEKCYSCKWWNYSYGCSNKKGICEFEPLKDEQSGKE